MLSPEGTKDSQFFTGDEVHGDDQVGCTHTHLNKGSTESPKYDVPISIQHRIAL